MDRLRIPILSLSNYTTLASSLPFRTSFSLVQNFHSSCTTNLPKRWKNKSEPPFQQQLKNPVEVVFGGAEKWPKDEFGTLYDKKPFKVSVTKYHLYKWCGCGRSHSQPFCDESCSSPYLKKLVVGGPVTYIAPEDKEIWFCNCKQTRHRPFCDGSHRNIEVQEIRVDGKFDLWEPTSKEAAQKRSSTTAADDEDELNDDDQKMPVEAVEPTKK